nr:Spo0E family sporulation regulatory protein-aspartic acid phosphatase [Sedimentibacter sp.]
MDNLILKNYSDEIHILKINSYEIKEEKNYEIGNDLYILDRIDKAKHELNNIISNKDILIDDEILEMSLYLDRLLMLYIKNSGGR